MIIGTAEGGFGQNYGNMRECAVDTVKSFFKSGQQEPFCPVSIEPSDFQLRVIIVVHGHTRRGCASHALICTGFQRRVYHAVGLIRIIVVRSAVAGAGDTLISNATYARTSQAVHGRQEVSRAPVRPFSSRIIASNSHKYHDSIWNCSEQRKHFLYLMHHFREILAGREVQGLVPREDSGQGSGNVSVAGKPRLPGAHLGGKNRIGPRAWAAGQTSTAASDPYWRGVSTCQRKP